MEVITRYLLDAAALLVVTGALVYVGVQFLHLLTWALDKVLLFLELKVAIIQFFRCRYRCTCGALQPTKLENGLDKTRKRLK